ncbi:DUF421 domain-containing protein [Nakamurella sp. YIM 132087]|uniref:DUF421 domain-containing protein n=1 Tax=Nakamurella alba TaxID=2665158 RepID=A0A7K1FNQ4_9ACTN|nr:YetF domain-containing protein [Nakamurella alba]MTD14939.1 DUF421 domain-containing protein [Nakamurella alba]
MEIVYRAAAMFVFLWIVTRIVGRSTLGELSTFELILFVTLGDMVQQAVTQQDYSFTGGILTISVFTLLTVGLSWINARWPKVRTVTHGVPVVIVQGGDPLLDVMKHERLSLDDLMAAARQQGFERFSDIRLAVLEANGQIAFLRKGDRDGESGAAERPTAG